MPFQSPSIEEVRSTEESKKRSITSAVMRIRAFCMNLDNDELQPHTLKDCTVVIDGQNFLHKLYEKSGLPSTYGCEGDKYAKYLKKYLGMFKDANVRCYFILKGGHSDINYKFKRLNEWRYQTSNFYFSNPVFVKELYKQILDEMGFEYVICEYESKGETIAFAKKYNCPVISYDIEFAFSGVPYIPYSTLSDNSDDGVKCGIFNLRNFLKKYKLTQSELAIFIALTDENIFTEGFFLPLFESLNMPKSPYKRNSCLLKWLSRLTVQRALGIVYKYVRKDQFEEKLKIAEKYIQRQETTGLPTQLIENQKRVVFSELDPKWFEKGVAIGRIAINYVNLYRNNIYFGAWTIENDDAEDSLVCSLDIIIYAFNLLTNFNKREFIFQDKRNNKRLVSSEIASYGTVRKPHYTVNFSPFENGWDRVSNLHLFDHFLEESLQGFNHTVLKEAPEDVRLLIIALVYFSRQQKIDTTNMVCSILLSYVMLGVVFEKLPDSNVSDVEVVRKPYLDPTTRKESVNEKDCVIANNILHKYFCMTVTESHRIFNKKLIHPFVEFQHCLVQLNNLNNLCGCTYKSTEYSKTFNGTFAYKFLVDIDSSRCENGQEFVRKLLNPATTVLSLFNGLFDLYQRIMFT